MLDIQDLEVRYGNVRAVNGISLSIQSEQITVLIGSNGAGKSSTVKAIAGLVPVAAGRISYGANQLQGQAPHVIAAAGISLCPEGRQVFPQMSVSENLLMGAYTLRNKSDIEESLQQMYDDFPRLGERRTQLAGTLSGGEQQMLAIARALMARPRLVILDEPSWGLAPLIVDEVAEVIKRIKAGGTTVLLVEQNARIALELADHAYLLETGKVVASGTGQQLQDNDYVRQVYLGA